MDRTFEFDPETHIGKVDGEVWPSTTQLLQEFGIIDFSNVPPERLEHKRLIGIRTHAATVMLDKGSLDEEDFNESFPECVPYLEGYRKFRTIENFEPERKEERLFSLKWKFHGQKDESGIHLCPIGGNAYAIIDYKCTWRMYESTGPQLASYQMLDEECYGIKIKKRYGLLLKPTGNYDLVQFTSRDDFTDFQMCVHLHWQKRNKYKQKGGIPK